MKSFKTVLSAGLLSIFMVGLPAVSSLAQDNAEVKTTEDVKAKFEKDKTGTNPMNFTNDARLYNEYQWLNTAGGGGQNITTAEFRTPFAGGKWQFRGKIRGKFLNADLNDNGSDDIDESGFGDMDLRFMTIPYLNPKQRTAVALGAEFFLPTASDETLGSGAWTVAPMIFGAYFNPFGPGSIIVPGYQHMISFAEEDERDRVHQGLIDVFMVKTWADNQFWGYVDPQVILDYENDKQFMLLELQAGMMTDKYFGTKGHSVYMLPSFGVGADSPYDFSIEVGYKIVW